MGEDESRWYYVGNGQLRCKDSNGWTDEYKDIDGGPKRAAVIEADAEVGLEGSTPPEADAEPGLGARVRSSLGALCAAAARGLRAGLIVLLVALGNLMVRFWHLIVRGYRKALVSASKRYAARQAPDPSTSDAPRAEPQSLMSRSLPGRPRRGRHRSAGQNR